MEPTRTGRATLVDLLDRVLDKGLVLDADLIISLADVPLIAVSLRAAIAGVETMAKYGMMTDLIGGHEAVKQRTDEFERTEETLRASEEKYRDLFESSRDAIMTLEPPSWRFTSGNPATVEMFGAKSEEEFISRGPWELSPDRQPDGRASDEKAKEMIGTAMREGVHFFEWMHRRIGGEDFFADVLLTRMERGGKAMLQATVRDLTERKRLENEHARIEEQLRASQKMEAIGQLTGGVAHDFNNLLGIINGYSELSLSGLKDDDPLRGNLKEIQEAGERATVLTRQLLAFSRRQVLEPRVLNLNDVLGRMDRMLRRLIGEDIRLATVLDPGLGQVKADPGQMEQVILNLALNGRDAMSQGGKGESPKLTLETKNVVLNQEYASHHPDVQPGPYVMMAVSDTGRGMDAETMGHIFEPFFTTKEKGKGTGLGLSTVYGIVKQSGGHVSVYSEPGRGTSVKVYLPQVDEKAESLPLQETTVASPRGWETILVVEDEERLRRLISKILKGKGYSVLEASSGEEALQVSEANKGPIAILITDVILPGSDGRETAEKLSSKRPEIKVLYMSGYTDNAIVHHGVLKEGIRFLQKPFTPEVLARKVREAIES